MSKKIGLIFNGVWSHYTYAKATKYRELYELLYVHDLSSEKLAAVDALAIPFQSNHKAIALHKDLIYDFLAKGKKVFVEGDSSATWLDASWEDRPVNNYWWVKDPNNPPVSETNYEHPVYQGLSPRQAHNTNAPLLGHDGSCDRSNRCFLPNLVFPLSIGSLSHVEPIHHRS